MFKVKCPKCKQEMLCSPLNNKKAISSKYKRCVYCGKTFKITENILEKF
jgi:transposase-like protein